MVNQGTAPGFAIEILGSGFRWSGCRPDGALCASTGAVCTLQEAVRGTWAAYGLPNDSYNVYSSGQAPGWWCYVVTGSILFRRAGVDPLGESRAPSHEAAQVACWEHWAAQRRGVLVVEYDRADTRLVQKIAELESACARKDLALTGLHERNSELRYRADNADAARVALAKERDAANVRAYHATHDLNAEREHSGTLDHALHVTRHEQALNAPLLNAAKALRASLDKCHDVRKIGGLSAYVAAVIQAVCDFMDATDKIG